MVSADPFAAIHENHEVRIMISWLERGGPTVQDAQGTPRIPAAAIRRRATLAGDSHMKWETPTATDLRFGFEITMYVSAR
jgi:coenzyme PQQ precursor peptide PqqA